MASPRELHPAPSSRWWVRLCQWLWSPYRVIWGTVTVGILPSVVATWLTVQTLIFTGTPLGTGLPWVRDYLLFAGFIGVCLLLLALLVGTLRHLAAPSARPAAPAPEQQQNRHALIALLCTAYRRQRAESVPRAAMWAVARSHQPDGAPSSGALVSWCRNTSDEAGLPAAASLVPASTDASLDSGALGAGKRSLLRELACELLRRLEDEATHPVTVIVPLSCQLVRTPLLTSWPGKNV